MIKEKYKHRDITGLKVSVHERMLILSGSDLSFPLKTIYLYICESSSWGDGLFRKNRATIERELNIPRSTVQKYLKILSDKGYILRVSHYQSYAFEHPKRFSFIYPLKYHSELLYQEDIDKIKQNALDECDKIGQETKIGLDKVRKIIRG